MEEKQSKVGGFCLRIDLVGCLVTVDLGQDIKYYCVLKEPNKYYHVFICLYILSNYVGGLPLETSPTM